MADFDLLVVGGGINGAGIARDAAGRGLSVMLCERDDLASHTSSASTKLIHGGLRYLEHYEFRLVRKALQEREVLLNAAPHIIWPMRFVMPHDSGQRPAWMIRAGLFLYDHLAHRERLPDSHAIDLRRHPAGAPLKPEMRRGFEYSDAWVLDSRLVVLNAMDAQARGARIATRTAVVAAKRRAQSWEVELASADGSRETVSARLLVNAAGPWVGRLLAEVLKVASDKRVRLVKGSHIVVRRRFEHNYAYIFQNPDKRIIFAIPFEQAFTLIGTTDLEYPGDAAQADINADEIDYLCSMASRYFVAPVKPQEVVWHYSGVRPLLEDESSDPSSVTRDYSFEFDEFGAPLLSVFGGKLTTYRKLAEEALEFILPALGRASPDWTAHAPLPGGDMPDGSFERFRADVRQRWPWLPESLADRLSRHYGTCIASLLGAAGNIEDLGDELMPGLFALELDYLMREEFALCADDVLWRRTKLGLTAREGDAARLQAWMDGRRSRKS
ncbi:glycerol-3-phosphate dehydrogenase [Niveibacterium umoris]|uniref:Glycerol-3-phosphate dehydrogenase n=1 Tax=Niveibacterium umoris TaxID=1193620 RepID=A0A840BK53_9RHOO|nr:glycerol-3-phosphate dehydrogenase [Niveibacterium umoris]MBB4011276.1 glycerol-3-phosphate dehydrogenase [Niveibacterium umoris]